MTRYKTKENKVLNYVNDDDIKNLNEKYSNLSTISKELDESYISKREIVNTITEFNEEILEAQKRLRYVIKQDFPQSELNYEIENLIKKKDSKKKELFAIYREIMLKELKYKEVNLEYEKLVVEKTNEILDYINNRYNGGLIFLPSKKLMKDNIPKRIFKDTFEFNSIQEYADYYVKNLLDNNKLKMYELEFAHQIVDVFLDDAVISDVGFDIESRIVNKVVYQFDFVR